MSLLLRRRALLSKLKKFLRTVSGAPPVICEACTEDPVENYKIEGNSFQDGTPTPDTPVEVESVGEKTKNLFNVNLITNRTNLINNGDGSLTVTGTGVSSGKKLYELCPELKVGDVATFSCRITNALQNSKKSAYIYVKGEGANVSLAADKPFTVTQELLNGSVLFYCRTYGINIEATPDGIVSEIQMELGESSTPYEPFGKYKIPVVAQGKNLFNVDTYGELLDSRKQPYVLDISKFAVGTKLTVSTKDAYYYKISDSAGGTGTYQYKSNNYTFTLKQAHIDLGYLFFINPTTWKPETKENLLNQDVLIEFGDTKTDFEPYIDETFTTNIYLTEPLRKVGEYADYIDFANSKVVKRVGVKTFNGSEVWTKHTTTKEGYSVFRNDNLLTPLINAPNTATFMTHSKLTDKAATADFIVSEYRFTSSNDLIIGSRLYLSASQTTVEDFAQWVVENKPSLYYPIASPTEELIDLPQLPTLKGTTVYTVDTTIQPSNMEISYYSEEAAEDVL